MADIAGAAESEAQAVYTGERKNGRMEGYGTYRFPSGTVYTGEFLDGEFHGEGTLQRTGAGYLDMLLMHWPCDDFNHTLEAWRGLEARRPLRAVCSKRPLAAPSAQWSELDH